MRILGRIVEVRSTEQSVGIIVRGKSVNHKTDALERPVLMRRLLPHYVPLPALSSESVSALIC